MRDNQEVFYIMNTLVSEHDRSRILGPLRSEELELKRQQYNLIVNRLPKAQKENYPFIVYKLVKIE